MNRELCLKNRNLKQGRVSKHMNSLQHQTSIINNNKN